MAMQIQIKRSTGVDAPTSLLSGELAFVEGTNSMYIGAGNPTQVRLIKPDFITYATATGSDKIMGDKYSNGKKLQITGWCIGLLIVIANVILVGFSVTAYINLDSWVGWVLLVIESVIGILYVLTLIYVSFVPVDDNSKPPIILNPPNEEFENYN